MKLKKLGAALLGVALLGATLSTVAADEYPPPKEFFINPDGSPACLIVVGSSAAAMDVVSASMLAAKVGTMAVRTEEVQLPPRRYTATHQDIPLYDWNGNTVLVDERLGYPVLDVPDATQYTNWDMNPSSPPTSGLTPNPFINYTLTSLWWFDDYEHGYWGNQNGVFDPWETHEEIQFRFDNLAVFDPFTGQTVRDNLADLLGGDIELERNVTMLNPLTLDNMFIPSLIYRADNVYVPPMIECIQTVNRPQLDATPIVDLDYEESLIYFVPHPYLVTVDGLPKFTFFGKLYRVVDAGAVYDYNLRTGEYGELFGTPYLVTGDPTYYYEQYLYKDEPKEYGGYTVLLKDVDVDHNKAWFEITDPDGNAFSFWMVLDPEHGFSPNLQQQGWSGEVLVFPIDINGDGRADDYYYNKWIVGRAENDVWADVQREGYEDDNEDFWWLFDVPMLVIDGVKVFVGANGTTGIEVKVYTLEDKEVFYDHLCCVPFVTEPNNYQLFLDAYEAGWDTYSGFTGLYLFQPPGTGLWPSVGLALWSSIVPIGNYIGNGFLDNNDGHIGNEYYGLNALPPVFGPYFPEANDLDRDGSGPLLPIGLNDSDAPIAQFASPLLCGGCEYPLNALSTYPDIEDPARFDEFGQGICTMGFHCPGQIMVELNVALCDIVEMAECLTRFVFNGPRDYFRIEMSDITWDDDQDGSPDVYGLGNDGLDWQTVMEISAGTYTRVIQVDIDETELVKLDIETDTLDKQNFNLILIGGPVANQLSKELEDLGIAPDDGSPVDWMYTSMEGDFKLYTDPYGTGKDSLMVAGADRDATRSAAERLISRL